MSKRVLFVDDEDWSVSAYFEILEDLGLTVDLAENGDRAINLLQKNSYDLIVLDVMFSPGRQLGDKIEPRESGAILLAKIRKSEIEKMQSSPDVPALVLTAITDQRLLDSIKSNKIEGVCRKPTSFQVVIEKVCAILGVQGFEL